MTEPRGARASRQRLTGKGTDRERRWLLLWTKHIGGGKALVPKCIARPASFMVVNKRKTKCVPIRCLWERGKLRGVLEFGLWGTNVRLQTQLHPLTALRTQTHSSVRVFFC